MASAGKNKHDSLPPDEIILYVPTRETQMRFIANNSLDASHEAGW